MHALRAPIAYDGTTFLHDGATVLVDEASILGVESFGYDVPVDCPVTTYDGTLLPGLIDAHVQRAGTLGDDALDDTMSTSWLPAGRSPMPWRPRQEGAPASASSPT